MTYLDDLRRAVAQERLAFALDGSTENGEALQAAEESLADAEAERGER